MDTYRPVKCASKANGSEMSNLDQICLCFNFDLFLFLLISSKKGLTVVSRNIISLLCVRHLNVFLLKEATCKAGNKNADLCFHSIFV